MIFMHYVCLCSDIEAATLRANKWIYSSPQRILTESIIVDDNGITEQKIFNVTETGNFSNQFCVSVNAPSLAPESFSTPTRDDVKPKRK